MKKILHNFLSQDFINKFYHLPEAIIANLIYGFPSKKLKIIGVTGTDGKTTTTNLIYQILKGAGKKVSMVSTINAVVGGKEYDTGFHVTSPGRFAIQKLLKQAKDEVSEYIVLEVTSHALDQYRFWGIKFEIGVITNITHEHLDYHKTFENYKKNKLKFIKDVKYAIINQNIKGIGTILGKVLTFGLNKGDFNQKDLKLNLKIPGDYNLENALAAMAVSFVLNIDEKIVRKTLENFSNLTGRMQEVINKKGIKIYIDFAHTPNALEKALIMLRSKIERGRLVAVFGSAGKRDIEKRSLMGQVAAKLADAVVITAEDPRGELKKINEQIKSGAEKIGAKLNKNLFIVEDRQEAINFSINDLVKKGDIVGIFGKGHESSMNLDGKEEIKWSDFEAVKRALNAE